MNTPNEAYDELPVIEPPHTEVHLSDYWAIVVKYKRLIILVVAFWLLAGGLVCFLSTPIYRGATTLDIVRQSSNVGFDGSSQVDGLEFLPSQIELIQSRDVAERVVKKLNLLSNPEFLETYPDLAPDPSQPKPKGPPTARQIARAAFAIQGDSDANIVKATSLVQITYDSPSRELAATIANALADAYIEWNIESRFRQISNSAQFLATQIEQAKRDIDEKEKALLVYASQKDILAVDTKTNPSRDRLGAFNDDYTMAVADRVSKEAKFDELQKTPDTTVAETVAAGVFAQMKADQARLEKDYSDKLAIYKPEWPAMQAQKQQVDDGNRRIAVAVKETADKVREAARSEYLTALRRETSMKEMMRSKQSEALNQIAGSSEYNNLRIEIDTKRALLDTLIRQQGEAEVLSRLREEQATNIRIVDRALRPHRPVKPSIVKYMAAAIVLGCGMGFGLAFFLSYLDRTLHSSAEIERFVQLPTLGSIPLAGPTGKKRRWWAFWRWFRKKKSQSADGLVELLPHENPRAAVSEAYRAFRTSLLFSRAGGVKVVAVTSVVPKEGKTATATNLAVVLSQLGRRVLLVDADLHQGRIHQLFGVSNRAGLVSILAEGVEPSRVIIKTKVPGVFVVTSGPETPNPSALLSSENMRRFLELAAANFDHVVIDTPPIMATYDVLVFGQYTDGVVLCVRAGDTPRDQVREVRDKLLRGGVPILGVVLNGRKLETSYYEYRYLNYGERARVDSGEEPPEATVADEAEAERGVVSGA